MKPQPKIENKHARLCLPHPELLLKLTTRDLLLLGCMRKCLSFGIDVHTRMTPSASKSPFASDEECPLTTPGACKRKQKT